MKYTDESSHLGNSFYKNVSELKLTREIQYFANICKTEGTLLIIKVPEICVISEKFQALISETTDEMGQKLIRILRIHG